MVSYTNPVLLPSFEPPRVRLDIELALELVDPRLLCVATLMVLIRGVTLVCPPPASDVVDEEMLLVLPPLWLCCCCFWLATNITLAGPLPAIDCLVSSLLPGLVPCLLFVDIGNITKSLEVGGLVNCCEILCNGMRLRFLTACCCI